MATTFQMPKVSRGTKLHPPAPLKKKVDNNINNNNNKVSSDVNSLQAVLSEKKETVIVRNGGIGASRRNLKLEKPRPLKSTRACQSSSEQENSIISKTTASGNPPYKEQVEPSRMLSPKTAQITADKLIEETLQELDGRSEEMQGRTRILSQVSHDSGYSETSVYSRQGSMLESLEESYQDDMVWKSEDETETFTPGKSCVTVSANKYPSSQECDNSDSTMYHNRAYTNGYGNDRHLNGAFSMDKIRSTRDTGEDWGTEFEKDEGIDLCEQVVDRLSTKENLVLPNFTGGQKTFNTEDMNLIEMELESMRDELGDSEQSLDSLEEVNSNESHTRSDNQRLRTVENNNFGAGSKPESSVLRASWHVVLREPICPTTMPDDILKVDRHLPGGPYSAKGRRRMFRSYKICSPYEKEPSSTFIQYSAEELILFGNSYLCRQRPDSWDYLTIVLPEVCLPTVSQYFDTQSYLDERSYVEEQTGYVKDIERLVGYERNIAYEKNSRLQTSNNWQTRDFAVHVNGGNKTVTEQPVRRGFGRPPAKPETSLNHQISTTFNQTCSNDFFPFKNHSDTRFYQSGSSTIPEMDQVDLDTKSDVRIRNMNQFSSGKLFSSSRNDVMDCVSKKQNWSDRQKVPSAVQWTEESRGRNVSGEVEEMYLNRNLPEQCPW